jgi:hypothetical protein
MLIVKYGFKLKGSANFRKCMKKRPFMLYNSCKTNLISDEKESNEI